MELYIEDVFLENFFYDGGLLYLAFFATKERLSPLRWALASALGGVFAICFPLLRLPPFLQGTLKWAIGGLICLVAFPSIQNRKEGGRYALTLLFFLLFSFVFGGSLLAVFFAFPTIQEGYYLKKIASPLVFVCFSLLLFVSIFGIRYWQGKKGIYQNLYLCKIYSAKTSREVRGFLDSGNLVCYEDRPVCFLSPDLIFDLFEEEILSKGEGQVCDEIRISTMAGERTLPLYQGEIEINGRKISVYFAPSRHRIGREYDVLLYGQILEEKGEEL